MVKTDQHKLGILSNRLKMNEKNRYYCLLGNIFPDIRLKYFFFVTS